MNLLKRIYRKSKKAVKFSVTDPSSFEELMSFVSSRIRVFSLTLLVFIVLVSVYCSCLMGYSINILAVMTHQLRGNNLLNIANQ
jgi:hypothetical protein